MADRRAARRRSRAKARKPYDLDSEGEETSDGSSSEKVGLFTIISVIFVCLCSSGHGLIGSIPLVSHPLQLKPHMACTRIST